MSTPVRDDFWGLPPFIIADHVFECWMCEDYGELPHCECEQPAENLFVLSQVCRLWGKATEGMLT